MVNSEAGKDSSKIRDTVASLWVDDKHGSINDISVLSDDFPVLIQSNAVIRLLRWVVSQRAI